MSITTTEKSCSTKCLNSKITVSNVTITVLCCSQDACTNNHTENFLGNFSTDSYTSYISSTISTKAQITFNENKSFYSKNPEFLTSHNASKQTIIFPLVSTKIYAKPITEKNQTMFVYSNYTNDNNYKLSTFQYNSIDSSTSNNLVIFDSRILIILLNFNFILLLLY